MDSGSLPQSNWNKPCTTEERSHHGMCSHRRTILFDTSVTETCKWVRKLLKYCASKKTKTNEWITTLLIEKWTKNKKQNIGIAFVNMNNICFASGKCHAVI